MLPWSWTCRTQPGRLGVSCEPCLPSASLFSTYCECISWESACFVCFCFSLCFSFALLDTHFDTCVIDSWYLLNTRAEFMSLSPCLSSRYSSCGNTFLLTSVTCQPFQWTKVLFPALNLGMESHRLLNN